MSNKIKIIIADNQYIAREGLKSVISAVPDFSIIAEIHDNKELLNAICELKPDVVIMDYNSPGFFQVQDIKQIKKTLPGIKILVISSDQNRDNIFKVIEYGVKNFLTKECDKDEIINAIYATAKGEKFFCTRVIDLILEKHLRKNEEHCEPSTLSARENEVTMLVAKGLKNKEIAETLILSPHTISTHRKNIMRKLRINSVSEMVLYAIRLGLVTQSR